ncbi:MAG: AEC family transporter [Geminicoccaceae bacterium]
MFEAIAPLILLIALGVILGRSGFLDEKRRRVVDALLFHLLMPAFILARLGSASLDMTVLADLLVLVTGLVSSTGVAMLLLRRPLCFVLGGISGVTFTSLLQGTIRNNFFIPFAIAETANLDLGGLLAMATVMNILPATALSVFALTRHGDHATRPGWKCSLVTLVKNPLVMAALAGTGLSLSGIGLDGPLEGALRLLGNGVLGLALLAVGAGLRLGNMPHARMGIFGISLAKLALLPLLAALLAHALDAAATTTATAVLLHTAPTAAGAYILARQLGGDGETMAAIISFQTAACMFTMPLMLYLLGIRIV